ncbi:hypothetical protein ACU4GA_10230 [Methylobacterium oryzae CBMB20]
MHFTVTARLSARRFAYQHASVLTALDQGMSLIAAGMAEVTITDGSGEDPDAGRAVPIPVRGARSRAAPAGARAGAGRLISEDLPPRDARPAADRPVIRRVLEGCSRAARANTTSV